MRSFFKKNILSVSNTRARVSALSSALRVMMSSFPAHFRIFDMLHRDDKERRK